MVRKTTIRGQVWSNAMASGVLRSAMSATAKEKALVSGSECCSHIKDELINFLATGDERKTYFTLSMHYV